MRVRIAAKPKPKVSAGKIIEVLASIPLTGNKPSHNANTIINNGPSQKCGMAETVKLNTVAKLSAQRPTFKAATMPNGTPILIAIIKAKAANFIVTGKRSANKSTIGFLLWIETPKSPCTTLATY